MGSGDGTQVRKLAGDPKLIYYKLGILLCTHLAGDPKRKR
jgi:hypothetical protein